MAVRAVSLVRKKAFWALLIPLLMALCAIVVWYVYIRPAPVNVTLEDGQIQVSPPVLQGIQGPVRFIIENQGAEPHQFILLYIRSARKR